MMTVASLIADLQRLPPHLPVKVLLSEIYGGYDNKGDFRDDMVVPLNVEDALDADVVKYEGTYALIRSI